MTSRPVVRTVRHLGVVLLVVALTLDALGRLHDVVRDVDWKLHHVAVVPVRELPIGNLPGAGSTTG